MLQSSQVHAYAVTVVGANNENTYTGWCFRLLRLSTDSFLSASCKAFELYSSPEKLSAWYSYLREMIFIIIPRISNSGLYNNPNASMPMWKLPLSAPNACDNTGLPMKSDIIKSIMPL